ncbi:MAG: phosphonate C-P lyase system protein PhnH [Spirochaetaceae bacterium]|nr:MAG: phosphonate C-P lyase system protein PhnH [Spirochaetaceae bacterium]
MQKVWDSVHSTQQIFRKLVNAFSFPGSKLSISNEVSGIEIKTLVSKPIIGLLLTILDSEVSFHISGEQLDLAVAEQQISQLTGARNVQLEEANFCILLSSNSMVADWSSIPEGNLEEPHLGATIIIETEWASREWEISGPGIQSSKKVDLGKQSDQWIPLRNEKNREFPLGVDVILVGKEGDIVALPRTTVIREVA